MLFSRIAPRRRRIAAAAVGLAALGLTVSACAKPQPTVSFYSGGSTVQVSPVQFCQADLQSCAANPGAAGGLAVRPGQPVQISVPQDVADSAWLVAFTYRTADGTQQQARSEVFKPGDRFAYSLTLPPNADQLLMAQVQQIGGITQDATGIEFVASAVWVVNAS